MAYLTEEMLLDFFTKNNGQVSVDAIYERFANVKTNEVSKIIGDILNKEYIDLDQTGKIWTLSEKGNAFIQEELVKSRREREFKELELEKTKVDFELAKQMLKDYPLTKSKANWGVIIAGFVLIIEFIRFLGYLTGYDK